MLSRLNSFTFNNYLIFQIMNQSSYSGKARIDPNAFTHSCDHSASYVPKRVPVKTQPWTSISDMSGRGFIRDDSTLTKDFKKPRETIRAPQNLDNANRFFSDNKRILE